MGRTPNPCVVCNHWLKFGKLFDYADSVDAQYVATGHYARCILADDGTPWLCRGVDHDKDQSYVLFGISQERFQPHAAAGRPVSQDGDSTAWPRELGLRVADKRDSQEICFVTSGKHDEFVRARRGDRDTAGKIVTTDGSDCRPPSRALSDSRSDSARGWAWPWASPTSSSASIRRHCDVVIGRRERTGPSGTDRGQHELAGTPPDRASALPCQDPLQLAPRCGHRDAACRRTACTWCLTSRVYGVAPGQAVVCYDGDRVLGGGWIE